MKRKLQKIVTGFSGCLFIVVGSSIAPDAGPAALAAQGRLNSNQADDVAVREGARKQPDATAKKSAATANSKNSKANQRAAGNAANSGAPNAAVVEKTFRVSVTLGDGRSLKGRIRVRLPERLSIVHVVDGIQYRKIVRPEQIRAVEFKRWRGRLVRQQESGQIFQFDVDRYHIELSGGQVLKRDGQLFAFLNQFVLENENGTVQLFSFWGDLQKKDGSWFTGMQGPSTSRMAAHKDVIQRIQFEES